MILDSLVRRAQPVLFEPVGGRRGRAQEVGGGRGPPGGRLPSPPGARDAAALPLDVSVQVVGPREALVAVLALVGTHARVDPQVVLQVVVVDELGVAVEADVGTLTCVLPHVDLEFVLSAIEKKKKKKNKTTCFHSESLWAERVRTRVRRLYFSFAF